MFSQIRRMCFTEWTTGVEMAFQDEGDAPETVK
jgi:hypothetical protein